MKDPRPGVKRDLRLSAAVGHAGTGKQAEQLLAADRVSIFLVDVERDTLYSRLAHGADGQRIHIEFPRGSGIAGRVARTGKPINLADAYSSPDFNSDIDRTTGYRTRSMLCMPVFDRRQKVLAVVQVLNKAGDAAFTAADEATFREFAEPLGVILESSLRLRR